MKMNLTVMETAELLNFSRRGIYLLLADGELTGLKIRSSLRITLESVQAYQKRKILEYQINNGINCVHSRARK